MFSFALDLSYDKKEKSSKLIFQENKTTLTISYGSILFIYSLYLFQLHYPNTLSISMHTFANVQ